MANFGFGITAQQINKLIGNEWSDDTRIACYMAAAVAELPDAKAYAKFVFLLNTLGIKSANTTKFGNDQKVETFTFGGSAIAQMNEDDMRKVCASHMWKSLDPEQSYVMIAAVTGKALVDLYEGYAKKSDTQTFVLHRLIIGKNVIYRICPDTVPVADIVAEGIRYLAKK